MEKRRNCSKGAISPLFHNIFNISWISRVKLHVHLWNVAVQFIFSSILQLWYVEVRISRSISESPLEFEITRVDCIWMQWKKRIYYVCRPRWLSWMCHPTGDQEVAGSTPAKVGNILSRRLIMKYFLRSFSPFHWFKKGSCQFLAKECAQYWLIA